MNVLFITLVDIRTVTVHNLYTDLMREFIKNGHEVYIASPAERRCGMKTQILSDVEHSNILKVKTGNIQKTNIIEKGISTLLLEYQIKLAIKRYFSDVHFDLVLYSTPPITLVKVIQYIKKRDNARTYLMLKDIFPQNAVDIGMMTTTGIKGLLYNYFRKKEKKLYAISDRIGCMSQANVEYVLKNNPEVDNAKVEICPNSVEVVDMSVDEETRIAIRNKYGIPLDKKIFVYGGNLGRPQGIDFMIECLKNQEKNDKAFFLIVGSGTEYGKIESYVNSSKPENVKLMQSLPKEDYDTLVAACDVGMIFLDHRFTIPNFPSRLLSYMQAKIPVLACTDPNTDVGKVIFDGGFGWWCESNDLKAFDGIVKRIARDDNTTFRAVEMEYLEKYYSTKVDYQIIMNN